MVRSSLALAKLLDDGEYSSVTEISEAEAIGKSYVSRILRLALLAPDIRGGDPDGKDGSADDA